MPKKKLYTVSTRIFKSKKEAEEQIARWAYTEGLREGSLIFEVTKVYKPSIKKVVVFSPFSIEAYNKKGAKAKGAKNPGKTLL